MAAHKKQQQPQDANQHAHVIAEAVRAAWHRCHGSGRIEVPVSVVAVLASASSRTTVDGANSAELMHAWTPEEFASYAKLVWRLVVRRRPYLCLPLYPLMGWVFEDPSAELLSQAHEVALVALRAGQVDLTGTPRRQDVDLLGAVVTVLRPASALSERGQFCTPNDVAMLMARLTEVEEGGRVCDPTMGTGGLFRAVAERMRETGRDPATVRWVGCDIDELAVACAAVNSIIWGLGKDILFYVGDALTDDGLAAAVAQRDQLLQIAAVVERSQSLFSLLEPET